MKDVYIVEYKRTPFSRSRPRQPERDVFNCYRGDDLMSFVYEEIVKRTKIDPEEIGDVLTGCAFQLGENWLYGGRTVSLMAKLPLSVPTCGVDRQCASSQTSIQNGAMEIMTGFSEIVLAGGFEHMTHVPMGTGVNPSSKLGQHPSGFEAAIAINMGLTAEKLFNEVKDRITREDMDRWSMRSHELAAKAVDEGFFKDEIIPIEVTLADGTKQIIDVDQSIRRGTTMEKLATLKPAFKRKGNITAGNSSPLNAGAAGVMLMNKEKMEKYNLKPLAKIVSMAVAAV
ncbi:MAG: acetyl-CoA C-acyltransferase, partial [Candidatus Helarchaeota archaeon]